MNQDLQPSADMADGPGLQVLADANSQEPACGADVIDEYLDEPTAMAEVHFVREPVRVRAG